MRLDIFLRNSGMVPRRPLAKRGCDSGLVEVDGQVAKASHEVRIGNQITLRLGTKVTVHEVLDLPQRPVPKARREEFTRLVRSEPAEPG